MNYTKTVAFNLATNYSVKSASISTSGMNLLTLITKPHFIEGYIQGGKQPFCHIQLRVSSKDIQRFERLETRLNYYFYSCPTKIDSLETNIDLVSCFAKALCAVSIKAGFPIFEPVQTQALSLNEFSIYLPYIEKKLFISLIDCILTIFNQNLPCDTINRDRFDDFLQHISHNAPKGSNTLRFLQTAFDNEIPCLYIEQNTWQFGYGASSCWLDSSFSDNTSILSTSLARNKISTARLLSKAGLPVPEQIIVQHEIEAINASKKIGFPLVLKPLDSDGGNGVFAGLYSEKAVKKAWQWLQTFTKTVLVEKQVLGKDYRLQILNGKLIWAIERIPAHIVGDGKSTIQMLVKAKLISITDAMILFLEEQGYTLKHILQVQEKLTIQGIANISAGGTPIGVFEKVHPDNKRLAETAANLLRLNIAGIDLIMPNIAESWLETTAAIIEVNAQPQFGNITAPHIYKDILLQLLPKKGRIPIVMLCGPMQDAFIELIQTFFFSNCKKVGLVKNNEAFLSNQKIASADSSFRVGKALLLNKQVEGLIFHVENLKRIHLDGLPFDTCDEIILLDMPLEKSLETFTLMKACKGHLITNKTVAEGLMNPSFKLIQTFAQQTILLENTFNVTNLSEQERLLLISVMNYCGSK